VFGAIVLLIFDALFYAMICSRLHVIDMNKDEDFHNFILIGGHSLQNNYHLEYPISLFAYAQHNKI